MGQDATVEGPVRSEDLGVDPQTAVTLHTATGSVYRIFLDSADRWWFNADNVENPNSRRLNPDLWWRIAPPSPWPPELGSRIRLAAPEHLSIDDSARVPGGGRVTSPVRAIDRSR